MDPDCFIGDVGFQIFIATGVDVSGATERKIRFRRPDGSEGEWTAAATTKDGVPGVEHVTLTDDLNQGGTWILDVEINGLLGFFGSSSPTSILVGRPRPGVAP